MADAVSRQVEALVGYLTACGGSDRFEFYDPAGEPDPVAARTLAESMRAKLGASLDVIASVHQSGNRVTVTLLVEAATV
jgi:hypothetical protein